MAFGSFSTHLSELTVSPSAQAQPRVLSQGQGGFLEQIRSDVFRYDCLDRKLKRHHITGIAFSAAVGIGLFQTSAEIIAVGGPVGAFLAYIFAGLVIFSVMRSLAEMVSVRPVKGPIIDFPEVFVDEALGVAVGIMYWLANCMSMVTLTIASAMFTQYWGPGFGLAPATFIMLTVMMLMNACGVRLYGNLEWSFKWIKILLIVMLCILMIAIKAGAGTGPVDSNFRLVPGYNTIGFFPEVVPGVPSRIAIPGTGGQVLAVWTCLTFAMFQFMGGEMALVTAGEAEAPRRDLPKAARYMYTLPVTFYLVGIFLVGLCINYENPKLIHPHVEYDQGTRLYGIFTATRSPFVIVIQTAGIRILPGFLNAAFLFSALTAANSALYVSSRTLFVLARRRHAPNYIKNTIGRTNNGHTPLTAIVCSCIPGGLAFLVVRADKTSFQELIAVLGRLYTGPMLCIYASECLAFLRFIEGMKRFPFVIDRNSAHYQKKHYRAHWQPLWAILGLVLCVLLVIFSGWAAIYDLAAKSEGVTTRDCIVDIIAAYIGPAIFFAVFLGYKFSYKTKVKQYSSFENLWYPMEVPDEMDVNQSRALRGNRGQIVELLSWIR